MKMVIAIGVAIAISFTTHNVASEELVDSGWIDIKPSELQQDREYERLTYLGVEVEEKNAIQTDVLNVVRLSFEAKNKTNEDVYFDLNTMALDDKGEILFVMNFSPSLFGISAGKTNTFSQELYVLPGTLGRVALYRFRFLGFK